MLLVRALESPAPPRQRRARLRPRRARSSRSGSASPGSSPSRTSRSRRTSLTRHDYRRITLLWSVMFMIVSVLYRPVEQLLSRTIADRGARGLRHEHLLRAPRHPGSASAGFPRRRAGAAHADPGRPASTARHALLDPDRRRARLRGELLRARLARRAPAVRALRRARVHGVDVALHVRARGRRRHRLGQSVVALGMAAAPLLSLVVVPWALAARAAPAPPRCRRAATRRALEPPAARRFSARARHGVRASRCSRSCSASRPSSTRAVLLAADGGRRTPPWPGFVFNVLLIARAPLQLFQAIQTSILPHLTRLAVTGEADPFRRSVQTTLRAIAVFASGVALAFLAFGPRADGHPVRRQPRLRPRRSRGGGRGHGPLPLGRHAQPGRARSGRGAATPRASGYSPPPSSSSSC